MDYADFIAAKAVADEPSGIQDIGAVNPMLFPFQADITKWALRRGRAAVFADCGLGKSPMQLEWANHVHEHTGERVLIVAPLGVTGQTCREGAKFGVPISRAQDQAGATGGITITNY